MHHLHCLAADIKEGLDIQIIGRQDNLKEHLLIYINELLIPITNISGSLSILFSVIGRWCRISTVMSTVFEDLDHSREDGGFL